LLFWSSLTEDQLYISTQGCDVIDSRDDCNDRCSLSSPEGSEERCNAVLDSCDEDVREGSDADRDSFETCGAWGREDTEYPEEDIYVLVYYRSEDTDTEASTSSSKETLIPLVLPREQALECDGYLHAQLLGLIGTEYSSLIGETVSEITQATDAQAELLEACIAADVCRQAPNAEWPTSCDATTSGCTVLRLTLNSNSDFDAIYKNKDDWKGYLDQGSSSSDDPCSSHPEQFITRTVWSRERILAARALVVEWECYRLHGTFGCGDYPEPSGYDVSHLESLTTGNLVSSSDAPTDLIENRVRPRKGGTRALAENDLTKHSIDGIVDTISISAESR